MVWDWLQMTHLHPRIAAPCTPHKRGLDNPQTQTANMWPADVNDSHRLHNPEFNRLSNKQTKKNVSDLDLDQVSAADEQKRICNIFAATVRGVVQTRLAVLVLEPQTTFRIASQSDVRHVQRQFHTHLQVSVLPAGQAMGTLRGSTTSGKRNR
eukprot:600863-Rhodomonas_salina.4